MKAIHCPSGETVTPRCEYAALVSCFLAPESSDRLQIWAARYTRASRGPGMKPIPFPL
jgi:hypothetical protein